LAADTGINLRFLRVWFSCLSLSLEICKSYCFHRTWLLVVGFLFEEAKVVFTQTRWPSLKRRRNVLALISTVLIVSGCADSSKTSASKTDAENDNRIQYEVSPQEGTKPTGATQFKSQSDLGKVARALDKEAIARSSALQEVAAAEAELQARKYDRYPQLVPTGTIPLNSNGNTAFGLGNPSIGVAIEQIIWDGGRIKTRLRDAELKVAEASLQAWAERNDVVFDGLEAYLEMSRRTARLAVFSDLQDEFGVIGLQLEARVLGGVADRGETLQMALASQELDRDILFDEGELRKANADLLRLLPKSARFDPIENLEYASSECSRVWPASEAPQDALARISKERAEVSEKYIKARRFPAVVLGAGASYYDNAGWSGPGVAIQLDASDMLGIGRRNNGKAGRARTRAALASYSYQLEETQADIEKLTVDFDGYSADIAQLKALQSNNEGTLQLYREQLDAGTISISDGIGLYWEHADTQLAIIDLQVDILSNCLRISRIRGLLAPFGAQNG